MKSAMGPTKKQQRLLKYLLAYQKRYGLMPTTREMAKKFGKGPSGVHRLLTGLSVRGFVELAGGMARGVRVMRKLLLLL